MESHQDIAQMGGRPALDPRRWFAPVDVASLVAFRIAFGGLLAWDVWRYLRNDWVTHLYLAPEFHFRFPGFGWVDPWLGGMMHLHFVGLGVLAIFVAVGFLYRLSAALFALGFG